MGCTSSRLLMQTTTATTPTVSPVARADKSGIAAGEKKNMASVGTTAVSSNTEASTGDKLIFEAADAIFGKPAVVESIPLETAAAISKSKCFDATDSLQLDNEPQTSAPPNSTREPNAPSLVRITSNSSFSSGDGTTKLATTPTPIIRSSVAIRKMPTPIVLSKKLSRGDAAKRDHSPIIPIYQTIAGFMATLITTILRTGSNIISRLSKYTPKFIAIIQNNPDIATAITSSIITILLHIITIQGTFVYDDRAAVLANPDVLATRPILHLFTRDFWGQDMTLDTSHKSYRPLSVLSLRFTNLRSSSSDLDSSAALFHLDNVILHGVVTFLYSRVCFEILGRCIGKKQRFAVLSAVLASILFAVHPIHTEPVASIVGRSDLLCGFFYLVGLWMYLNGKCHLAVAAGMCSTFSKEVGITVYGIYIMSDFISIYTSKSASYRGMLSNSIKNVCAAVLLTALHLTLHGKRVLYPWSVLENSISLLDSRKERASSYAYLHTIYLWKLIYPWNLSYDYGYPCLPHQVSLNWTTIAVYSAVLAFLVVALKRRNAIMLWAFSLTVIPFIPASNIFFPVGTILAERLLYLPSMGFCLLVGVIMATLVDRSASVSMKPKRKPNANLSVISQLTEAAYLFAWVVTSRFISCDNIVKMKTWRKNYFKIAKILSRLILVARGTLFILLCAYTYLLAMQSYRRSTEWKDEITLFGTALNVCPRSLKVLNNYAYQFLSSDPLKAIPYLEEAVEIDDDYDAAHFNLGLSYMSIRRYADAMQSFTKSLSINPNHGTRILLANAANKYLMENGYANDDKYVIASSALEHVDFVIENSSVLYPRAYYLRCILGRVLDFPDDSNIKFCQEALRANRSLKVTDEIAGYLVAEDAVLNTIGLIFKDNRCYSEAINAFNEGLAINPMSSDILVNLASLFTAQEQYDLATEYYDRAEHFITDPSVRSLLMTNKGYSLERQGFHLAAKAIYQEAIEITSIPHPQLVRNFENIELFCAQNICN